MSATFEHKGYIIREQMRGTTIFLRVIGSGITLSGFDRSLVMRELDRLLSSEEAK